MATKPNIFEIREGRPVVWPIARDFWATGNAPIRYGVSVRLGGRCAEITAFASSADAWEAGVNALAGMIEKAAA